MEYRAMMCSTSTEYGTVDVTIEIYILALQNDRTESNRSSYVSYSFGRINFESILLRKMLHGVHEAHYCSSTTSAPSSTIHG